MYLNGFESLLCLSSGILTLAALFFLLSVKTEKSKTRKRPCPEDCLKLLGAVAVLFYAAFHFLNYSGMIEFAEAIETLGATTALVMAGLYYKLEEPK